MGEITTKDGGPIFYKDWGQGQPIVFHHGWPLSADDWDSQMLFFLRARLPGHRPRPARPRPLDPDRHRQRHGHLRRRRRRAGRASRAARRHPRRPLHRRRRGRPLRRPVRRGPGGQGALLISAVPPVMVKSDKNPGGTPIEVFDGFRAAWLNRAQFYLDVASGPFYGFNRPGREGLQGRDRQLVAPGHDGRDQGPLRLHQGVLRDRLHRGPEADRASRPW